MSNTLELIGKIRMDSGQAEGAIGRVTRGTEGLSISSRKAESAVKNFASVIRSGQEPVTALADSVGNLTRAFKLGLGATIAIVGIIEVIKSLVYESQRLNGIADKLSASLKGMAESADLSTLSGAVGQLKQIKKAVQEANEEIEKGKGGVLGRAGKTIADMLGGSEYRLRSLNDLAKNQEAIARDAAKTALRREIELESLKAVNPIEAKRVAIKQEFFDKERELIKLGYDNETIELNRIRLSQELVNIDEEAAKEKAKANEEAKKANEESFRRGQEQIRQQDELNEKRKRGIEEYKKGLESIKEKRLAGSTPLLERLISASEGVGIKGIGSFVEQQRKQAQGGLDKAFLERFGLTSRDYSIRGELFPSAKERVSELVNLETERKSTEDAKLYETVYGIGQAVIDLKRTIEDKLNVTILRSAY
jgi:hypothetical protein